MSISGSFALFFLLVLLSTTLRGQIPVITSFSPASGPVGTTVLISGSNFSASPSANIVYFGGVRAFVSAASLTSLSATVPAGTTYQPITVTTNNLTAYSSKAFIATFPGGGLAFTPNSFAAKIDSTTGLNANGMVAERRKILFW